MSEPHLVNLALQGGGAHGAYTWGVLDRLLDDGRVRIEGLSGTSAGAMNAVVLADGMRRGGPEGAREALHDFWRGVSDAASVMSPVQRTPLDVFLGNWNLYHSPGYLWLDLLSRLASPSDINPLNLNPLRDLVERLVDFDSARHCERIKLFVSATNVRTGRIRVFERERIDADVVMASACLPLLFQAVEIDGEHYWDGGYSGNPALFPFFYRCSSSDIVVVQINPIEIDYVPQSAREI
ncbi:MAG: patatin-like phospholipase family protein, partial [Candidatus Competibacterales bacterium]|nr:patatin-like phospholipase family protein [Candidatus Competibacterales bacterium]